MVFIHTTSGSDRTDAELVSLYRQSGDSQVLAELFDRYLEMVFAVCIKYLKDDEAAKDATMEVYGHLTGALAKHEVENFRGWLYRVAKNYCLMQLRSEKRFRKVTLDEGFMQSEEELHQEVRHGRELDLTRLSRCIEGLAAEQKQIISLFYLQQKCYKEICSISGLEWNTVRSHVQNGRRNLKICMETLKKAESHD